MKAKEKAPETAKDDPVRFIESREIALAELQKMLAKDNPREIPAANLKRLSASVRLLGQIERLCVNERTGRVFSGHARIEAMKRAGLAKIRVDVFDLPAQTEMLARFALNYGGARGRWQRGKARKQLEETQLALPAMSEELELLAIIESEMHEDVSPSQKKHVEFDAEGGKPGGSLTIKPCPGPVKTKVMDALDEVARLNAWVGESARWKALEAIFASLDPREYAGEKVGKGG